MRCAIMYHMYNLKNVKITLLHGCFSRFLNGTNGTESCNASHIKKLLSKLKAHGIELLIIFLHRSHLTFLSNKHFGTIHTVIFSS